MPPHRRVISTRGSFIFFSLLLCSQMLLSILMGKSFLNDENASFNLRSRNLYLLLSITKIFISFLKASFNLRSKNLYLLLSTIPTILKSFFHFGNLYKLLSILEEGIFICFFQYLKASSTLKILRAFHICNRGPDLFCILYEIK